jgi:hypothetical protein
MKPKYGTPEIAAPERMVDDQPRPLGMRRIFIREVAVHSPIDTARVQLCPAAVKGCVEDPHEFIAVEGVVESLARDGRGTAEVLGELHRHAEDAREMLVIGRDLRSQPASAERDTILRDGVAKARQLLVAASATYVRVTCLCPGRLPNGATRALVEERDMDRAFRIRQALGKYPKPQKDIPDVEGVMCVISVERDLPSIVDTLLVHPAGDDPDLPISALEIVESWSRVTAQSRSSMLPGDAAPRDLREVDLEESATRTLILVVDSPAAAHRIGADYDKVRVSSELKGLSAAIPNPRAI